MQSKKKINREKGNSEVHNTDFSNKFTQKQKRNKNNDARNKERSKTEKNRNYLKRKFD